MKRLLTLLLAAVLACSMSISALAFEETTDMDVIAQYISVDEGEYKASIENGVATVSIEDVTITATGIPEEAVSMIVVPISESEEEAYAWFVKCLADVGTPLAIYDIYFLTADGSRMNADGVSITMDYPYEAGKLSVYAISTDSNRENLSATIADGKVTFVASGSHYYVLTEEKDSESGAEPDTTPDATPDTTPDATPDTTPDAESDTTPDTTPSTTPSDSAAATQTGDNAILWTWGLLLVLSAGILVFVFCTKQKKMND